MSCYCGGEMGLAQSVRQKSEIVLTYQKCKSCGRVEPEKLKHRGEVIATGWAAMDEYRGIVAP